jgi:DnaK suppressor protein
MPDDAERRRLLADIDDDLEAVEQALARLDAGTYSSCEVCGDPIADELLALAPARRRCDVHEPQ